MQPQVLMPTPFAARIATYYVTGRMGTRAILARRVIFSFRGETPSLLAAGYSARLGPDTSTWANEHGRGVPAAWLNHNRFLYGSGMTAFRGFGAKLSSCTAGVCFSAQTRSPPVLFCIVPHMCHIALSSGRSSFPAMWVWGVMSYFGTLICRCACSPSLVP